MERKSHARVERVEICRNKVTPKVFDAVPIRLWLRVEIEGDHWIWKGTILPHSKYGTTSYGGKKGPVHRVFYRLIKGSIPPELEIDHLCRVRLCVNPDHLEPVTHKINMKRGSGANKTHCPQGHEYNEKNTRIEESRKRKCRICDNLRQKEKRRLRGPLSPKPLSMKCQKGHPKIEENGSIGKDGYWHCKTCRTITRHNRKGAHAHDRGNVALSHR